MDTSPANVPMCQSSSLGSSTEKSSGRSGLNRCEDAEHVIDFTAMDQSHFLSWQLHLHNQRLEMDRNTHSIPDSQQHPWHSRGSQSSIASQGAHIPSDAEFETLMSENPLRSLHHAPLPGYYSPWAGPLPPVNNGAAPAPPPPTEAPAEVHPANDDTKKKRAWKKQLTNKGKKSKKSVVDISDSEEEGEDGRFCWTDPEVLQLIAFWVEMDKDFEKNAKKQGKTSARLVAAWHAFTVVSIRRALYYFNS